MSKESLKRPNNGKNSALKEDKKARVGELVAQGMMLKDIVATTGVATDTVKKYFPQAGTSTPRGGPPTPAWRLAKVQEMLHDGASHREISETLGMGHATIAKHFPGTGWTPKQAGERRMLEKKMGEKIFEAWGVRMWDNQ